MEKHQFPLTTLRHSDSSIKIVDKSFFMRLVQQWGGVVYIGLSVACSIRYVMLVMDSMTNDSFWPNMTPTGAETFLLDLFSKHLMVTNKLNVDIFDPSKAIVKDYGTHLTTHTLYTSYPRMIILSDLTSMADAIKEFRVMDPSYLASLMTQYCWADFDRRWELAHTFQRQVRCYQRYQTNGATYLEAVLRNIDWDGWSTANYPGFMFAIGNAINQTSDGQSWLASIPNAFKSIESEVKYWTDKGVVNYILQWNNRVQTGISESISVINVFGARQPLTTYHIPYSSRGATWTSFGLYWAFFDDLWAASVLNGSLVRNTSNFVGDSAIEMLYYVYPYTPASIVIHDVLGPFQSIDAFYMAPSTDLIQTISIFDSVMLQALQTNVAFHSQYQLLKTATWDPVPPSWRQLNYQYYGGNPMCNARAATHFVQSSFSFDDVCGQPKPLQLTIDPQSALFAYSRLRAAGSTPSNSCQLCLKTAEACILMMHQLDTIYNGLISNATIPNIFSNSPNVSSIIVEFIQFAQLNSTSVVLRQHLLRDVYSFFGYAGVYSWVNGEREVVSFEGDAGIFHVLSEPLDSIAFAASAIELPNTTSQYLWLMTVITTSVLFAVAIATSVYSFVDNYGSSYHLFYFNRVAGPVWLGRPLMLLRSATAIIVLSTSPIAFDGSMGLGRFHFEPRSIMYRFLLASEASWLTDVITDVLLVFTQDFARVQALVASLIFWLAVVCLESVSPIHATATIERTCTRVNMDNDLTCTSGSVHIGSTSRALVIVGLSILSVVVGLFTAKVYQKCQPTTTHSSIEMLSAAASAFCPVSADSDIWVVHASIACMSGIFRTHLRGMRYILDTKLWVLFTEKDLMTGPTKIISLNPGSKLTIMDIPVTKNQRNKQKMLLIVGLCYLVGTVVGSLSYIQLADVNFGNDFWWANFNSTGTLTFIVNWYDKYRAFTPKLPNAQLDSLMYADTQDYSKENTVVTYSSLYASIVQFDVVNDIASAIRGLRRTDGCLLPWVATQYCWLDFDRKYSMASTLRRQQRCQTYQSNGAMYLEAPLRNVDWSELESCWGTSFDVAIAQDLHGSSWLTSVKSNSKSEAEEVVYWLNHNITTYTVQWQNYKSIGLVDTFSIENAFGLSYPISLQSTNGSFRFGQESSMKMYWTFARDLWAISTNDSGISGLSLLRESSRFAFQNITPLSVYYMNNTLLTPLDPNLALFAAEIGPFGSVDLIHVPVPESLLSMVQTVLESISTALASNGTMSQKAYKNLPMVSWMMPVPMSLKPHDITGGSFLCDQMPVPQTAMYGMGHFYSFEASCGLQISESVLLEQHQVLFALMASGISADEVPLVCSAEVFYPPSCIDLFQSALNFSAQYLVVANLSTMQSSVLREVANVEIYQYFINKTSSTRQLFHQPVLDVSDPTMVVFGWLYLYEWAMGIREVVRVEGDYNAISIISTAYVPFTFSIDAMEVPRNLSSYCRALCKYVSFILAMISIIASLYSLLNHFTSEGFNLLETNRVCGLVWIGRPLLLVRCFTALAILCTAPLELQAIESVRVLASSRSDEPQWMLLLTKLLAAGEVTWLLYIIQDLAMVFTKETTSLFGPIACLLTWFISMCLSIFAPVIHEASINRQCSVDIVDYQLVCSTGTLAIGSSKRFVVLIATSFGMSIILYFYFRWRHALPKHDEQSSILLSCGAKYLFDRPRWIHSNLYYIDYSSAALTGLLVFPKSEKLYVFDVKTWRILTIDTRDLPARNYHLVHAVPLVL